MGDHADDALDFEMRRFGVFEGSRRHYRHQHNRHADVTCIKCLEENLRWRETENGWRLFDGDKEHICPLPENVIDDFEDLTEER